MAGASSSRLLVFSSSLLLHHQRPINLFRLARRHNIININININITTLYHHLHLTPQTPTIRFYSGGTNYAFQVNNISHAHPPSHPWPEWSHLLETLSIASYYNGYNINNIEDEFMENENLSKEFVAAANLCLAFATHRPDLLGWLAMKDIEVIINNGYPFLFKSVGETERRMRSFLQGSNEASSVDLMKYILSYASNPQRNIKEATESSVRRVLQEIVNLANRGREQHEQMPRNLGPNITMKRGDWICPKCSFMNFARNTKCLECEETRPQRELTDGEWDCPRCNFFNYRKNTVCLKCECSRPDTAPLNGSNSGYVPSKHTQDSEKEDKTQRWFKKVKELHGVTDSKNEISHDIPQITPIHKEENRVIDNKGNISSFVPFPPNHFAKKENQEQPNNAHSTIRPTNENSYRNLNNAPFYQNLQQDTRNQFRTNEPKRETLTVSQQTPESMNGKSGWTGKSLEGSVVTEPDPLDMSEEAKAESWFKRVAQIKDISELSQIPDEDFPSIMPMRKGVNRFVVSKRKTPLERRLTSPQYRKNLRVMSSDPMKKEGNNDD
ncbi:zinc finger protein VAR3, chloroplastic-like [Bidens hawaiensis]|uniref:zinc finger protein VAR3, chloroplastic-like n=1 Tax=Bidens hawaiensis TaxID=980011 RepID=UPI004049B295